MACLAGARDNVARCWTVGGSLAPGPQDQEGLWRGSEATRSMEPPDPSCTKGSPAGEEAGSGHLCPQPREGQMVRASWPP